MLLKITLAVLCCLQALSRACCAAKSSFPAFVEGRNVGFLLVHGLIRFCSISIIVVIRIDAALPLAVGWGNRALTLRSLQRVVALHNFAAWRPRLRPLAVPVFTDVVCKTVAKVHLHLTRPWKKCRQFDGVLHGNVLGVRRTRRELGTLRGPLGLQLFHFLFQLSGSFLFLPIPTLRDVEKIAHGGEKALELRLPVPGIA
mmetsp:Transcript_29859/g.53418  ORF Transcript_29859/g.53418 Transcript_29859/m.53418 type:complete len:200 (+) Transcript_29859:127-726(+)